MIALYDCLYSDCFNLVKPISANDWLRNDPNLSVLYFAWEMAEEYSDDPFHIIAPLVPTIRRMACRMAYETGLEDDLFQAAILKLHDVVKQPTPTGLDIVDLTVCVGVDQIDVAGWCSFDVESQAFCGCDEFRPLPSRKYLLRIARNQMIDCKCKIETGRYDYRTFQSVVDTGVAAGMTRKEATARLRSMQNGSVATEEYNRELAYLKAKYPGRHHDTHLYPPREIMPESEYRRVYAYICEHLDERELDIFQRFFPWDCHTTQPLAKHLKVTPPTAKQVLVRLDAAISRIVEKYPFNF